MFDLCVASAQGFGSELCDEDFDADCGHLLTTEFHGLDQDLLQKALNVLVKRGKAQIFGQEDSQGVKFF